MRLLLVPLLLLHASTAAGRDVSAAPRLVLDGTGAAVDALPLKEQRADVEIAGVVAHVRLTQVYENTGTAVLSAAYVFPGSTRAAVHGMRMTVGTRTLRAQLRERAAAEREYDDAVRRGRTAGLLRQDRPNVFRMNVGNILPADVVSVELEYSELLVPEEQQYEFVLPAVVGPRYAGTEDADTVAQPAHDPAAPARWDVALRISAGLPLVDVMSPSHRVGVTRTAEGPADVVLDASDDNPGNRDFILRYRLAGDAIHAGAVVHRDPDGGGTLLAMVQPPARLENDDIPPREYVFVVDVSGSMRGQPLAVARDLLRRLVDGLRPVDRFNVVLFESTPYLMSPHSVPGTRENLAAALQALETGGGGGGTEMLAGLRAALGIPRTRGMSRSVVLITDGFVNVEHQTFKLVRDHLREMNVFAFGIGSSVNRHLIEGIARAGRGEPFIVDSSAATTDAAERFWRYVSSPVLTEVDVAFRGIEVRDVLPARVPDLFASRPLVLLAHYTGQPRGEIVVTGRGAKGRVEYRVPISVSAGTHHPVLPRLWARQRITDLTDAQDPGNAAPTRAAVLPIALQHGVLSQWTAFVAVDDRGRTDAAPVEVNQPAPVPAGMSWPMAMSSGALGVRGRGAGGGGWGYGSGAGGVGVRGEVSAASPVVMGSFDRESIRRVFQARTAQFKACYERALVRNPGLQGKLVVTLHIGPDGKVRRVGFGVDTVGAPEVKTCVERVVKALQFPVADGGGELTVTYPLLFRAPP
ncbi:MAG: AgmX/PglI C-terminal domain-containing protein [Deltaproteobacteria bacterium]|nr:AgmX/PglI C-terminal domain-containing protein [Deltaproteobacteria bacterium]